MVGRPYTTLGGYAMGFTQEPGYYMASPFLSVTTTGAVVHDPTGFWDTMDMAVLTKEHTRMQVLHDLFRESAIVRDLLSLVGIAEPAQLPHVPRGDELN